MPYFHIRISNNSSTDYVVEAENAEQADELATDAYNSGQTTDAVHRIDDTSNMSTDVSRLPDDGHDYRDKKNNLRLEDI